MASARDAGRDGGRKGAGARGGHAGGAPSRRAASGGAGGAKKKRWTSDERIARGRPAERPRGGDERPRRPSDDERPNRRAGEGRPQRDRTDHEGSGRDVSGRQGSGRRDDARRGPAERSDRAGHERATGRKGGRIRVSTGRPNWEPRGKDARHRPASDEGAGGYGERRRPSDGARDDERRFPRRSEDDRPRRDRDDRPQRSRDDRARDDRPRRDREDRPERTRDDRPRRDREDRPARDHAPAAPPPVDDPVLERLRASAVQSGEVEGTTFADLGLGANIVRTLEEQGAVQPFPIQASTIPDALLGRDVLGRGRTGSGKTIAFGAPLVERILQSRADRTPGERRKQGRAPSALILAPTRELALQIDRTVQPIARSVGLFTTQVYGGVPYARQYLALSKGVDIVIGTPGRVEDLVEQGRLDLSQVDITVLDEADHMAELGFLEPVQRILRRTPGGGQRMLFSASLDTAVTALVDEFLRDPVVHEVAGEDVASETIDHRVLVIPQREKRRIVGELVADAGPVLVFVRTRAFAEELTDLLDDAGIEAVALHGDLTQPRRSRNLQRFSQGRASVLVATDVAARGIHIDDVGLVIQADAPDEYKTYLHRSGRTGRAGKHGTVVTLVAPSRRRRTQELLERAGIEADWSEIAPGDAAIL